MFLKKVPCVFTGSVLSCGPGKIFIFCVKYAETKVFTKIGVQLRIRKKAVDKILVITKKKPLIFNLGHGILPTTPIENVKFLVDYIRNK